MVFMNIKSWSFIAEVSAEFTEPWRTPEVPKSCHFFFSFFKILTVLHSLWDLSSPTRD